MQTVVLGKEIENTYKLISNKNEEYDEKGNVKYIYFAKPVIRQEVECKSWREICRYEGEPRYNSKSNVLWGAYRNSLNISEDEKVYINEEIFRADLNEMHLHTDKIIEERNIDKELVESYLNAEIERFNEQMIESNDKLKAYCDLHKLVYGLTDCLELFKLVYPNSGYVIEDGVLKEKSFNEGYLVYPSECETCISSNITTIGSINTISADIANICTCK